MMAPESMNQQRAPRNSMRRASTVFVAVAALGAALTLGACGDDSSSSSASSSVSSTPSAETSASSTSTSASVAAVPTVSASELVLPEGDFPQVSGGKFSLETGADDDNDDDVAVDKPECRDLVASSHEDERGVDQAERELELPQTNGTSPSYKAKVKKRIDPDYTENFDRILAACGSFTLTVRDDGRDIPVRMTMERLSPAGVDGAFNGVRMVGTFTQSGTEISLVQHLLLGVDRGTSFQVSYDITSTGGSTVAADVERNLVEMFNAQRTRITAAN